MSHRVTFGRLAMVIAVALAASSCASERVTMDDLVRSAVTATTLVPRTYTFVDEVRGGAVTTVEVEVEDDFRHRAIWDEDGTVVYEEVVRDDALAVLAHKPAVVVDRLGRPELELADDGTTGAQELVTGEWIVDEVGAPTLTPVMTVDGLGLDPVVDAVGILQLVLTSVEQSPVVTRWDDSGLEYDPERDPFRAPESGADDEEVRYDVAPAPPISRAQVTDATAAAAVSPAMLRQMAIYVRDGLVTEVRLRIDASGVFEQLEKAYGLDSSGTDRERSVRAFDAANEARQELGDDPIVARDVSVTFAEAAGVTIVMPTGKVASLAFLKNRGSKDGHLPRESGSSPDPAASSTPSPTPTSSASPTPAP